MLARAACSPSRPPQMHHGERHGRQRSPSQSGEPSRAARCGCPRRRGGKRPGRPGRASRCTGRPGADACGIATSARRVSASSAPGSRRSSPPAARPATASRAFARVRGNGRSGRIRVRRGPPAWETGGSGRHHLAHRLPVVRGHAAEHQVRAPATETCWPTIARGHLEAVDRAGHANRAASCSGPSSRSRPSSASIGPGSAIRPNRAPAALRGLAGILLVVEPGSQRTRWTRASRRSRRVLQGERATIGAVDDLLHARDRARGETRAQTRRRTARSWNEASARRSGLWLARDEHGQAGSTSAGLRGPATTTARRGGGPAARTSRRAAALRASTLSPAGTDFQRRVTAVERIPYGKITTYSALRGRARHPHRLPRGRAATGGTAPGSRPRATGRWA